MLSNNLSKRRVARKPHASGDAVSRQLKARKIEALLEISPGALPIRLLEIGTGSGLIAQYFAEHPSQRYIVDAVDLHDSRVNPQGYRFSKVSGTGLPFEAETFDVVISNHVIEHVGELDSQLNHLSEIRRVLKPQGIGYLAVPNRWQSVEPHYRVPFLSWLPRSMRSPYLHIWGKGDFYDCVPLQLGELEAMLTRTGFRYENIGVPALRLTLELESASIGIWKLLRHVPDRLIAAFPAIIPTLIYKLRP